MTAPALSLVITMAGLERFTAAQLDDDVDLTVAEIGLTADVFVVAPTLTALPGEFRRLDTLSGDAVGNNIVHLLVRDEGAVTYAARGLGLFLADGTLFAVYGQATPIFEKSTLSTALIAIDIAFPTADINELTFGDTNFIDPPATTDRKGVVELATNIETAAGADAQRAVTPAGLDYTLDALLALIGGDLDAVQAALEALIALKADKATTIGGGGLVTGGGSLAGDRVLSVAIASTAEINTGTENGKAITPLGLAGLTKSLTTNGYYCLPGGAILQWGQYRASVTSQSTGSISFPIAFPNACLGRGVTPYIAAGSTTKDLWAQLIGAPSTTGLSVQFQSDDEDNQALDGFDWIAIGW